MDINAVEPLYKDHPEYRTHLSEGHCLLSQLHNIIIQYLELCTKLPLN